jgi:hypothetical protein
LLEATFQTVAVLLVSLVTGGFALGNFVGKIAAWLLGKDRGVWGDFGGIVGGMVGLSLFVSFVIAMVTA